LNPFDIKAALLAKHAQHVVSIHFPIALFIAGVVFDFLAQKTKKRGLAEAAYYNLLGAAIFAVPAVVTSQAHEALAGVGLPEDIQQVVPAHVLLERHVALDHVRERLHLLRGDAKLPGQLCRHSRHGLRLAISGGSAGLTERHGGGTLATSRDGGALGRVGDDPAAKSSTVPGASEQLLADLGLPKDEFTCLFACSRVAGWSAHVLEQYAHNRLIRPQATYVGPELPASEAAPTSPTIRPPCRKRGGTSKRRQPDRASIAACIRFWCFTPSRRGAELRRREPRWPLADGQPLSWGPPCC